MSLVKAICILANKELKLTPKQLFLLKYPQRWEGRDWIHQNTILLAYQTTTRRIDVTSSNRTQIFQFKIKTSLLFKSKMNITKIVKGVTQ